MKQHIIPKSVLRNFTDDIGHLYCFDRVREMTYKTTPTRALRQKDMYTFKNKYGEKVYLVEELLSRLEGRFQQVVKKVLDNTRSGILPQLTSEEINPIRSFCMVQLRRSRTVWNRMQPDGEKLFFDSLRRGIQKRTELNQSPLTDKEIADLENLVRRREDLSKFAWVSAILSPLPDALLKKGIVIGFIEDTKRRALAIGENPVIVAKERSMDLSDPKAQVLMPISSDVVVSLAGTQEHRERVKIDHMVSDFNGRIVNQSDTVGTRSERLTKALCRRWKRSRRR